MIQLDKVSRSFTVGDQQVAALRGIDLNIAAGDYVWDMPSDWKLSDEEAAFLQRIAWETVGGNQAGQ